MLRDALVLPDAFFEHFQPQISKSRGAINKSQSANQQKANAAQQIRAAHEQVSVSF
jgi:hypothetical protein